ncbi:sulfate permease [Enterococcus ureilyticus]|uniref:Sulfate permease n=1 Tax=Enterococcus ureilyticus TaxID=1131292 RepID=A0A1E5HBT6_9ENTE|nr:SulP family inorganic anion transporter [Enterococcus ureilyticus]MBM7690564.1 SulP family sulfate permease [Enterococcus ureilyticus]OEG22398.1 sulfate permease [Enterococcus ureilyticus]
MLFSIKKEEWIGNGKNDLFAGLVSSIAVLPEVVGFAIIAGVNPMTALFASATTILIISFTGGRPAMVSAAAGSMALVMAALIKSHGLEYMIAATILTGIMQLVLGYLGIQRLMKFIPKTVMFGFVNALAILIFLAQVQQLPGQSIWTYFMVIITIMLMYGLPKVTKAVPPALIVIIVMTVVALAYPGYLQKIGDMGNMSTIVPTLSFPWVPFTVKTFSIIFPTAVALTMVGLIESLLTIPVVDKMTGSKGDNKREVKSQGLANIVTGLFGGPAGCAMIGQAVVNVKSGGRKRLSTFVAGMALLILIFGLKDIMIQIPTAALIGIMITVSFETFEWESLSLIRSFQVTESLVMLVTIGVVVYTHNLAIGIFVGVLLSAVIFMAKLSTISIVQKDDLFAVKGPLFFASTHSFLHYFETVNYDNEQLTIDFSYSHILDHSGVEALKSFVIDMKNQKRKISIIGLDIHNPELSKEIESLLFE